MCEAVAAGIGYDVEGSRLVVGLQRLKVFVAESATVEVGFEEAESGYIQLCARCVLAAAD